jgi:glycosyltransferase involved in cell wall biosynthesis
MFFSIIVPVFNRPNEIDEFLQSVVNQDYIENFEVIIVEDGSTLSCFEIVAKYLKKLKIQYIVKTNSGPGDSRNRGMSVANGDYFLIFDSDCILPSNYLSIVHSSLTQNFVHCYGGPDQAMDSFSDIQKAINYSMTSILTTGGIRGGSESLGKFQPRSFNMGISKTAFEASKGFGNIHPGEDPDLTFRLWDLNYETQLISNAYVFHKRRIDWGKFYQQVNKFGKVRPILNVWHPKYRKISFYLPFVFVVLFDLSILLSFFGIHFPLFSFGIYFLLIMLHATFLNKSFKIGCLAVFATLVQFYGYSLGFIQSLIQIQWRGKNPKQVFPNLFFEKNEN